MHLLDWAVVVAYIAWLVWDGVKRTKLERTTESYFLANRSMPWWAVGLSVMATQLSAITLVGTTGQGYNDGLRFVQFYYGLPLAMVILCVTLVPFFYRARVYTAYEYLERRFDLKTRTLTSLLFLLSRGMSCGAIAAAPAVVLSVILGWSVTMTALLILVPAVIYTMLGGVQAVTWTDVKTMGLTVFVLVIAMVFLVRGLPDGVGVVDALTIAGGTGRLQAFDFRFTLTETYTFWSGMLGGLFLMLSYFGCDQSQVQRYLTAKSVDDGADVAADERLLEDSAAGARADRRRVHVSVLPVQSAAAAVQPGSRRARAVERIAAAAYDALQREFEATFQARRQAAVEIAAARACGRRARRRRAPPTRSAATTRPLRSIRHESRGAREADDRTMRPTTTSTTSFRPGSRRRCPSASSGSGSPPSSPPRPIRLRPS